MTKDEALRLALKALESTGQNNGYHGVTQYFDEAMVDQAIPAIKAALEAKDEPVAVMELHEGGWDLVEDIDTDWLETLPFGTKLYTTPPQRKPLTDEEIEHIRQQPQHHKGEFDYTFDEVSFARAIEAAHGIKGEA